MFKKVRSKLNEFHILHSIVRHTENAAHVGYLSTAALGFHEFYGIAAGLLLVTVLFSMVLNGGEA